MTTMAKIFVGLNLILACSAFGAAAALLGAQDVYKDKLQEITKKDLATINSLQQRNTEKDAKVAYQRQQASESAAAATAAESARNTLQGEMNKATEVNTQLQSTNERYSSELKSLGELLTAFNANLKAMQDKTTEQTALASEWQRKFQESESENARLSQAVNNQSEENTNLTAEKSGLDKALKNAKFLLDVYTKKYGVIAPRPLPEGVVLSIKATDVGTFVAISVGSKDKVRVGDEYHLSRGGEYVGRIQIIRLSKDSAYGRADERWIGKAWPPRQNDKAWAE